MIPRDAAEAAEYLRIRALMAERAERSAAHLARCAAQERDRAAGLRADAERVRILFPHPTRPDPIHSPQSDDGGGR